MTLSTPFHPYGVVGEVPLGYLVVHEWVGKIVTTVISKPFFLGSTDHRSTLKALNPPTYETPLRLGGLKLYKDSTGRNIAWTTEPGDKFYKIIQSDAYPADYFINASRVYQRFKEATDDVGELPPYVARARLLYGAFAIAVEMDYVDGKPLTEQQLKEDPQVHAVVVQALRFLAKHRLIHIDVRGPNVIQRSSGQLVLIDYDDCEVCENPPASFDEFYSLVAQRISKLQASIFSETTEMSHMAIGPRTNNYLERYPELARLLKESFDRDPTYRAVGSVGTG